MKWLEQAWYGRFPWLIIFLPLEWLFCYLAGRRRLDFQQGKKPVWHAPVPLIVVGNISVGGAGKTPLVVRIVELLQQSGYKPGVVSRGYGGQADNYPCQVAIDSDPNQTGDEPLLIVQRCGCPLVVDPDRARGCQHLLDNYHVDIIVSDDGLQHYRLHRDIEIAVVDGQRGLGNTHRLPVGPLREPPERLQEVDFVITNGDGWHCPGSHRMSLRVAPLQMLSGERVELPLGKINAVAGIGNPQRFYRTLASLGYEVIPQPFADHHCFKAEDLVFENNFPVIMTEKDAVKCRAFAADNRYYLPINAELPKNFEHQLLSRLSELLQCS